MEKINVANLTDGQHILEFRPDSAELEIDSPEFADLELKVVINKTGSQIVLDCQIRGKIVLLCDRCVEQYLHCFDTKFEIVYKYDYTGEQESNDENIKFISPKTVFIDISNEVRDYILLSVPMKAVPPEKDGICSFCGKDVETFLNPKNKEEMNPVWEKLIKLKTKEE